MVCILLRMCEKSAYISQKFKTVGFCSNAPAGPISLAAVQKMLGHDRLATTEIYLNLTESHVIEEYQNIW